MFEHIRIVLVETSHPGNIGATARAMKNMGLTKLYLVKPKHFPSDEATARAAGAQDVLEQAVVCDSLLAAVGECAEVIGCTAQIRSTEQTVVTPRLAAENLAQQTLHQVAFVFGRESSGLTNEELKLCHAQLQIPTNAEYSSLNLAQAVQIICYELRIALVDVTPTAPSEIYASLLQHENFFEGLLALMAQVDFFDPAKPRSLDKKIRHIFTKAKLTQAEMNVLQGFVKHCRGRI